MDTSTPAPMRPVIVGTLVVCLAVAVAPWLTGGQEAAARLVSGGALLLGVALAWLQPGARRLKWGPLGLGFGALIAWAMLSLGWTANQYSTVVWVLEWAAAGVAFWLAYVVAGEPKGRVWMLRAYLVSAGLFSVGAVAIFLTGEYNRLTGTFWWANPAAAYLIPAILLSLDEVRRVRGRQTWWWMAAGGGFLTAFWLTDSRLATIVLGVLLAAYLLLVRLNKAFWIHFLLIVVVAFGLSIGLGKLSTITAQHRSDMVPGSRFAEAVKGESKSGSDRWYFLGSAFQMWFAHPVGGVGAGAYGDVHPQYQQRVVSASANAHNLYVQVLAELGLVGALLVASVMLALGVGTFIGLARSPESLPVVLGIGGLVLHFGVDIDASYPALLMLVAVLLGLVYRQWLSRRGRAMWLWPVVAACLLAPVVSLYLSEAQERRGQAAQEDGDYAAAAAWFARAQAGVVYDPDVVNAEGIAWYGQAVGGGPGAAAATTEALRRAREAQALDPFDGQHHQLEGRVLAQQGDLKGAAAVFRAALRLDPLNRPDYALDLAAILVRAGDSAEGVKTARAMLNLYPRSVIDNRNFDETLKPTLANLEALIGNVAWQQGDVAAAREAAARALLYDPKSLRGRALRHQVDSLSPRPVNQ